MASIGLDLAHHLLIRIAYFTLLMELLQIKKMLLRLELPILAAEIWAISYNREMPDMIPIIYTD